MQKKPSIRASAGPVEIISDISNSLNIKDGTISHLAVCDSFVFIASSLGFLSKYKMENRHSGQIIWNKIKETKIPKCNRLVVDEICDIIWVHLDECGIFAYNIEDLSPVTLLQCSELQQPIHTFDVNSHKIVVQYPDKRCLCLAYTQNNEFCAPQLEFEYSLKGLMTKMHFLGEMLLAHYQGEDKVHLYHVLNKVYHKVGHKIPFQNLIPLYTLDANDVIYLNYFENKFEMAYVNGIKTGQATERTDLNPYKVQKFSMARVPTCVTYCYPYAIGLSEKTIEFKNLMADVPSISLDLGNILDIVTSRDIVYAYGKTRVYPLMIKRESFDLTFERTLVDLGKNVQIGRRKFLGLKLGRNRNPESLVHYLECLKEMTRMHYYDSIDRLIREMQLTLLDQEKSSLKKFFESVKELLGLNIVKFLQREDCTPRPSYFFSFLSQEANCVYCKYLISRGCTSVKVIVFYVTCLTKLVASNPSYMDDLVQFIETTTMPAVFAEIGKSTLSEHPKLKSWVQYPPLVLEQEYSKYCTSQRTVPKDITRDEKLELIKKTSTSSKFTFSGIGKKIKDLSSVFQKKPPSPVPHPKIGSVPIKRMDSTMTIKKVMTDEDFAKQWSAYLRDKDVDDKTRQIMNALTREKKLSLLELHATYSDVVKHELPTKPVNATSSTDIKQKMLLYGKPSNNSPSFAQLEKTVHIVHHTKSKGVAPKESQLTDVEVNNKFTKYLVEKGVDSKTKEIMEQFQRDKKLLLLTSYERERKENPNLVIQKERIISTPQFVETKSKGLDLTDEELDSQMLQYLDSNGVQDPKTRQLMMSFPKEKKFLLLENFVVETKKVAKIEFDRQFTGYHVNFNSVFTELKEPFQKYLEKESNSEPFEFILALNQIPNDVSIESIAKFQTICDVFIAAESKKEINIGGQDRSRVIEIRRQYTDPTLWTIRDTPVELFSIIRKNIIRDLKHDSFGRFTASNYGYQVISSLQGNPSVISKEAAYIILDKLKNREMGGDLDYANRLSEPDLILDTYLKVPVGSKVSLLFIREQKKAYHSALMIGNIILEWNDVELCIPRIASDSSYLLSYPLKSELKSTDLDTLANLISRWNQKKGFQLEGSNKTKFGNAQDFVEAALFAIGIKLTLPPQWESLFKSSRDRGSTKLLFTMNQDFQKKFGQKKSTIQLDTHEKLDTFLNHLLSVDKKFRDLYMGDYSFLAELDASFWRVLTNIEQDITTKKEELESLTDSNAERAKILSKEILRAQDHSLEFICKKEGCPFLSDLNSLFTPR